MGNKRFYPGNAGKKGMADSIYAMMMENTKIQQKERKAEKAEAEMASAEETPVPAAEKKQYAPTSLILYRHYVTYQGAFSIWPAEGADVDDCFSKTILHVMRWLRMRLKGAIPDEDSKEAKILQQLDVDYPDPENSRDFHIEQVGEMEAKVLLDINTLYRKDWNDWTFRLLEPDNNNDRSDVQGRTFVTNVLVKKEADSVTLGVKVTCRESKNNQEEASVYRPGFVKSINEDGTMIVGEYGLSKEYAFTEGICIVNGKSNQECEKLYAQMIDSPRRQMPVVFIPENYYEANKEPVEFMTRSILGFGHVVVVQNGVSKLFANCMNNQEYINQMTAQKILVHRSNHVFAKDAETLYFDTAEEDVLKRVGASVKKEPKRKQFTYDGHAFYTEAKREYQTAELEKRDMDSHYAALYASECERREKLEKDYNEVQTDRNNLESAKQALEQKAASQEATIRQIHGDNERKAVKIVTLNEEIRELQEKLKDKPQQTVNQEEMDAFYNKMYQPLLHCPQKGPNIKEDFTRWIEEYYSEYLIVHPKARKALKDDDRPIDWNQLCRIIHYIAGYTIHMNEGGTTRDENIARSYDPCSDHWTVENVSSGKAGALDMFPEDYQMDISQFDSGKRAVYADKHVGVGKGRDAGAVRVYFYYDAEIQKSIIGSMPLHLRTVKDPT